MAAGYEMLSLLTSSGSVYKAIERQASRLETGIRGILSRLGLPYRLNRVGSMFTLFFTEKEVVDYASASASDRNVFAAYFREMLAQGIYLPPSQFEAAFISAAHSTEDIAKTLRAVRVALERVSKHPS
jgi:glutamate-1-semialdehyde 2,1-aminomutase